jgi:hypothetical protein
MARPDDEDTPWPKQLLLSVGALLAVALVIGGVISVVALAAAKVTGIEDSQPQATSRPTLVIPSGDPTTSPEAYPDPQGQASQGASSAAPSPSPTPHKKVRRITLEASPRQVSANGRIDLSGSYRGGNGRQLQVQRLEGGSWVDFPVSAPVHGGSFHTYIFSGRVGANRFRVQDPDTGRASNPVRVVIG